jgi:hypothetical protein
MMVYLKEFSMIGSDSMQHYLTQCSHPDMVAARKRTRHNLWNPLSTSSLSPSYRSIIAFTDGSSHKDGRSGAGALVVFPPRRGLENQRIKRLTDAKNMRGKEFG